MNDVDHQHETESGIARSEWEWFGNAAHLIVGSHCRFHLATRVGPWLVSTVGEYVPDYAVREIMAQRRGFDLEGQGDAREADWLKKHGFEEIGFGRKYETMVFRWARLCDSEECGCGLPTPDDWEELDSDGYNDAASATRGHYAMCERWSEKDEASTS